MMNLKKLLIPLLCLTLLLSACENAQAGTGSENPSTSPSTSPAPAYVAEFTQALAGVDPDTVLFTVDGLDVTADFYLYWLAYDCYSTELNMGISLNFDETNAEGVTLGEFMKEDARQAAVTYLILEREAEKNNAGLTQEQQTQWEEQKAALIESVGQEEFELTLQQMGISEEMFDRVNIMTVYLYENVKQALIPPLTEEEAEKYRTEQSIYGAKHILLLTADEAADGTVILSTGGVPTNEDGSAFTGTAEEYNAAAKAKLEDILAQIKAASDPAAKFDELMHQYSQDTGLATNPDGYTFTPESSLVDEFKDTVYGLEPGEVSDVVESGFGYHILLRTLPDVNAQYQEEQMLARVQEWTALPCSTTPTYDSLDAKTCYANYLALTGLTTTRPEEDGSAPYPSDGVPSGDTPSDLPTEAPSASPVG